ncbi:MAG: futalosine hydrolase, partial [Bacteroidetes bacterium]
MKILLIAATELEIAPTRAHLQRHCTELVPGQFVRGQLEIDVLITGVGLPLAAYALGRQLARYQYDLLIQAGVAGAIDPTLKLGEVVEVVSDCFA